MAERLIVEHLDDETLVYDTESDEAHCLGPDAAAEFEAASDDVSRREVIRRLALVGAAAAGAAPLVRSIVAPTPAQALSGCDCDGVICGPNKFCALPTVCANCIASGQTCNSNGGFPCCTTCNSAQLCPGAPGVCP